ncbi:hypothetical protein [Acidihalobacter ferrooxydans]|uniref:Uncharacterized protein n=1 Tax=Acidihalobacter ferrooxydans TaxID=1765967 RepID=A0A1P8UFK1_9GAMM|nr:hypothetical protein [Acidihalobacter ferrooxydans]APZ42622.1 hypothetical protein BW247_05515 [Acidihalobacter ferrooxydans]
MGATITCARCVGAIKSEDGKIFYALFEKTYERNCYPHTPHWECVGFGPGEAMVRQIFNFGSETCGGMLRGPSRNLTPSGYIGTWLNELSHPKRLRDISITMKVVDKEFVSTGEIHANSLPYIKERLAGNGFGVVADLLNTGGYRIDRLSEEAEVLHLILNGSMGWRFISPNDLTDEPAFDLGWNPPKGEAPTYELTGVYRIDQSDIIVVQKDDGTLGIGDHQYAIEDAFIKAYGNIEVSHPGHWRKALKDLKKHFEEMPSLPDSARITVDREKVERGFPQSADNLVSHMGSTSGILGKIPVYERNDLFYAREGVSIQVFDEKPKERIQKPEQLALI